MIQLFSMNAYGDEKARRIFRLFGIPFEEISDSLMVSGLSPAKAPVIRDGRGDVWYEDEFFENNIILYSLGETCPNCRILRGLLNESGIPFTEIEDREELAKYGYTHLPVLAVYKDGGENHYAEFNYKSAYRAIKKYIAKNEAMKY